MFPVQWSIGKRFHDSDWESHCLWGGWWFWVCKMWFEYINGVMQKVVIGQQDWEDSIGESQETNNWVSFFERFASFWIYENCQ